MAEDEHTDGTIGADPAAGRSVTAMIDQLEAAKRELEIAEAARRARADEVTRIAETVESSVARAIEEATAECDDLERRLQDAKRRLRELEAARSKARIERFATSAPTARTSAVEGDPSTSMDSTLAHDGSPGVAEIPARLPSDEVTGSWHEVLEERAQDGDPGSGS